MKIVEIREQTVPISRYADPGAGSSQLNTTMVAVVTDSYREGAPVVGFGFSSIGRFGQSGLLRERFIPRLLAAPSDALTTASGDNLDPFRAWDCMMQDEKPGGHGERSVAVGTLDMALWDLAAKVAQKPLYRFVGDLAGTAPAAPRVPVYAGGGYYFSADELARLKAEVRQFLEWGYTRVKIKIGARPLSQDLARIEAALALLPSGGHLAVDAMNRYDAQAALEVARALRSYNLLWFEDVSDPLDFETQARIARVYEPSLAAGEALFSLADARNLVRYAGLRPDRDVLLFDPAHCYGLVEYLRIVTMLESSGWSRKALQPHGGHLFSLHVAAGLGLGGTESNPHNFKPFGGFGPMALVQDGTVSPPEAPGIGIETHPALYQAFRSV